MTERDLQIVSEQIADMARAGLPLDQGLSAVAQEMGRGRLRRVVSGIADDLRKGMALPDALRNRKAPGYYAALVEAGVRSGRIADVLTILCAHVRFTQGLRWIIVEALAYPTFLLVVGTSMMVLVGLFLFPQIAEFLRMNATLTPFESFLMAGTENWFLLASAPFVLLFLAFLAVYVAMGQSETPRHRLTCMLYGVPLVGTMIRAARLSAFSGLLAILIEQEVTLVNALGLAGESSKDPIIADHAREMHEHLMNGESLVETMKARGFLADWVAWMVSTGEKQNRLAKLLRQIADQYRAQAESRAYMLRYVLPPMMIMVVGGMAALLYLAIAFPVVRMLRTLI